MHATLTHASGHTCVLNAAHPPTQLVIVEKTNSSHQLTQECRQLRDSPSPIHLAVLLRILSSYPRKRDAVILRQGFIYGFRLGFQGQIAAREARNLPSLTEHKNVAISKIQEEVRACRVAGPFNTPPFQQMHCSPLGLVPKHEPGDFRLIHHLSWPRGGSVNDGISDATAAVSYSTFDGVLEKVKRLGNGCLLAKTDIKSAFRLLPVHPHDYHLLGFKLDGQYYFDRCMPFGARSSCANFERFSKLLNYCTKLHSTADSDCDHYLDDFIFMGRAHTTACYDLLDRFTSLCDELGVPLAHEKQEGPTTTLTYLGLVIDTEKMEVRVPQDKVQKALRSLKNLLSRRKVTLKELQSIIGSLSFLSRAIRPGRTFLQRLIALTRKVRRPHHYVQISSGARLDTSMWQTFLSEYNGVSAILPSEWLSTETIQLYTDSSATMGYGAYFSGNWFNGNWSDDVTELSMAVLELFPIALATATWATDLRNKKLIIFSDNQAVTEVINSQSARCSKLMFLLRQITLTGLKYNFLLRAQFVPGKANGIADALSRHQMSRFRALAPKAAPLPTPTPIASELLSKLKLAA